VNSGAVSLGAVKDLIAKIIELCQGAITVQQLFATPSVQAVAAALPAFNASGAVTEDNFDGWQPVGNFLTDQEITDRTKQMTEAVAAEQFVSGFALALQIMSACGGAA
jgi:hypothetical protein